MTKVSKDDLREIRERIREKTNPDVKIVMPARFINEDKTERPFAEVWTVVPIEGYCVIDMDWKRAHEQYDYVMSDSDEPEDWEKVLNPDYDPNVKRNEIPDYCKRKVCFRCLEKGCQYFAYAEYTPDTEEPARIHTLEEDKE